MKRLALAVLVTSACESKRAPQPRAAPPAPLAQSAPESPAPKEEPEIAEPSGDSYAATREAMVRSQLQGRDIVDRSVLAAMRTVPRHEFVPEDVRSLAYADQALPIGYDVTISQPYIVALMTQLASVEAGERVLDVGTGSGYQAAVLAQMGAEVYGIEIIEPLAEEAGQRLERLGYAATVKAGDGYQGWPEHAPFDAIIVAAAAPKIPEPLREQLAVGGRLVIPVGKTQWVQRLTVITRTATGYEDEEILPVAFVPMTGEIRE
jgi:protein-L-isoaspartate(D-aspartate) O-methyltransferase